VNKNKPPLKKEMKKEMKKLFPHVAREQENGKTA